MYNNVIPKADLAGYEPWQLADFARAQAQSQGPALPTVQELEQIRADAHAEGFQSGLQEGREAVQREVRQWQALLASLGGALGTVDAQVTQQLLQLALACARKLASQALQVKPELVLENIKEAIAELPAFQDALTLQLHPQDAELVREHLDSLAPGARVTLQTDAALQRGGCRVQTRDTHIDASMQARWARALDALSIDPKQTEPA